LKRNLYEVVLWHRSFEEAIKEKENIVFTTTRLKDAQKKMKELFNEYGYTKSIEIYKNGLFFLTVKHKNKEFIMNVKLLVELIKNENRRRWPSIAEKIIQDDLLTLLMRLHFRLKIDSDEGFKIFNDFIQEQIESQMDEFLKYTKKQEAA
jgi:hypothetical protein